MKFRQEIDSYDISVEDDDTVKDILSARWTFLSFNLVQICAEISQQINGKRPMSLISLLHVGGKALLATEQYQSVEDLFLRFSISVDDLVNQYEASGDELFCHCALNCVKAFARCKNSYTARDIIFTIVRAWVPKCESCTIDCQEHIIKTLLHAFPFPDYLSLELYDLAYTVCNINNYSQYGPDMAMYICYHCADNLRKCHDYNPKTVAFQGQVWLHRALFHANMKPRLSRSTAALENLCEVYMDILAATTNDIGGRIADETSKLAVDVFSRLIPAYISLLKGKDAILGFPLENALAYLVLTSFTVATLSDLDTESLAMHCRKLAQLISPFHLTVEELHFEISLFCVRFSFLSDTEKCFFEAALIIVFSRVVNEQPQAIDANLFSRTKAPNGSINTEPDPAVVRTTIDIFIRELMLCGKCSHARVLQEAFRLWPCERAQRLGTDE